MPNKFHPAESPSHPYAQHSQLMIFLKLKAETQSAHSKCVSSVAFSLNGKTIVSCSIDQTLKVWDAGASALITLNPHAQS